MIQTVYSCDVCGETSDNLERPLYGIAIINTNITTVLIQDASIHLCAYCLDELCVLNKTLIDIELEKELEK